jgi:hypothetical protein
MVKCLITTTSKEGKTKFFPRFNPPYVWGSPVGLGSCSCVTSNWINGPKPTGVTCTLFGVTDSFVQAALDGLANLLGGSEGKTIGRVGPYGQPQSASDVLPGSQVLCQNSNSTIAGACPYSPGRTACLEHVTGQQCDSPDPANPPPGQNVIWSVDANGVYPDCSPDGPTSTWNPIVKAIVQGTTPSLWCSKRGYSSQMSFSGLEICTRLPGYEGNQCQFVKGCNPECTATNQFCNNSGADGPVCECLPGYFQDTQGPCSGYNTSSNATCSVPCLYGNCATPEKCTCAEGWSGDDCSVPLCPNSCNNVGKCTLVSGVPTCVCPMNFGTSPLPDCGTQPEWALAGPCPSPATVNPNGMACDCSKLLPTRWVGNRCDKMPPCSVCCPPMRCTCQQSATQADSHGTPQQQELSAVPTTIE